MKTIYCGSYLYIGEGEIHQNWALCVSNGKIIAVGAKEQLVHAYPEAEVVDRPDWLILPPFIDAHDHGRGVSPAAFGAPDSALETWIPGLSCVRSDAYLNALYDGLLLASSGVTTVLHSHNPAAWGDMNELKETARGYCDAGIRAVLCPPFVDQNNLIYQQREAFANSLSEQEREKFRSCICDAPMTVEEYFRQIELLQSELADQLESRMVSIQLHPAGLQWCSDEALRAMQRYAQQHDMRIHMHMLETRAQRRYEQYSWHTSGVKHLQEIGLLTPRLSLAHMVWTEEEDWKILHDSGVSVVTNPSSNLRLHSGVMPLYKALENGVNCAIGLDGCGLDDDQDYLREMRVCACNSSVSGVTAGLSAETMLALGTRGGARVTEIGGSGVLKAGETADFVCLDMKQLRRPFAAPGVSPLDLTLLRGTRAAVDSVFVRGSAIVAQRKSTRQNMEEVGLQLEQVLHEKIGSRNTTFDPALLQAMKNFYAEIEEKGGILQ